MLLIRIVILTYGEDLRSLVDRRRQCRARQFAQLGELMQPVGAGIYIAGLQLFGVGRLSAAS